MREGVLYMPSNRFATVPHARCIIDGAFATAASADGEELRRSRALEDSMTRQQPRNGLGRRAILRGGGAGALAAGAALAAGPAAAAPDQRLDGVWRTTFARTLPSLNPFLNVRTFTCYADGTAMLGGPPVNPEAGRLIYRDTGSGEWLRTGDRRFIAGVVINNYGEDGGLLYETILRIELTLDPSLDSLSGTYESRDIERDGALRGTRGGEITAERIRFPA
jgi:hypothetical protein